MKMYHSLWKLNYVGICWILSATLVIVVQSERCFDDTNCATNQFCKMDQYGQFTICYPCLVCEDYYKMTKTDTPRNCAKSIKDCGKCLTGYQIAFDESSSVKPQCVPIPPPKVDSGLISNTTYNQSANLSTSSGTGVYEESNAKSAGLIAGGVALGVVAVAAIALGAVFGYKYYTQKKEGHKNKTNDEEGARTTELQELHPQPTEVLTATEVKNPEKSEEKQTL